MDDGCVHHPLAKTLPSLVTNDDEVQSWIIEIWMKNHLVCDSNYNTINIQSPQKITRNVKKNVGLIVSVGDYIVVYNEY